MTEHDIIIIGGGPGGYVAAIRAAQLGLNTACIDMEKPLGGTCVRVGCIPSKALLESSAKFAEAQHDLATHGVKVSGVELDLVSMLKRKDQIVATLTRGVDGLMKKNKITRYHGKARITGRGKVAVEGPDSIELAAKHIVIATGSKSAQLRGVALDGANIVTSTEALSFDAPPKRFIVIGAGYIGLELGSVWSRLGSQVTVLEYLDRILPGMDSEPAVDAKKILAKQGITFNLSCRVTGATVEKGECVVTIDGQEPLRADKVLLAVGRVPNVDGLGLDSVNVAVDKNGRVVVDEHFRTAEPGIYAIGDVIRGPMLAHKASEEGIACVEHIVTGYGHVNYDAIPGVCYTEPEIASVGKTEEELKQNDVQYKKGSFPFMAIGRAKALGNTDGKVIILADAKTDRILGVHIIGPRAGDLIAEAVAAIEFGATSEDIARTSHAHPTLAEAMKEAALAVDGRQIHM
jgi:dihydrolipoamide dehydrogenase